MSIIPGKEAEKRSSSRCKARKAGASPARRPSPHLDDDDDRGDQQQVTLSRTLCVCDSVCAGKRREGPVAWRWASTW
jgi:hypothetical protein